MSGDCNHRCGGTDLFAYILLWGIVIFMCGLSEDIEDLREDVQRFAPRERELEAAPSTPAVPKEKPDTESSFRVGPPPSPMFRDRTPEEAQP